MIKWIGQHIYDYVSRFRNDVYLEDISSGTIASGGNLGLDSNNKIVKATEATGDITSVNITTDSGSGSAGEVGSGDANFEILGASGVGVTNSSTRITAVAVPGEIDHDSLLNFDANEHFTQANITTVGTIGTGVWNGTAIGGNYIAATQPNIDSIGTDGDTLSILGDTLSMTNTTSNKPAIDLTNQTDDSSGPVMTFVNQRFDGSTQAGEDDDYLGTIKFSGYDDQGTPGVQNYASIYAKIHDATSGEESGELNFSVANHDGGAGEVGLKLTGGSENGEIDVTVGNGSNCVVDIPGSLTLGTALGSDYTKHIIIHDFKGYAIGDGSNFERPPSMTDAQNPFEHNNTAVGSDGLTAHDVSDLFRTGGKVMSRNGTIKRITGWATGSGSSATCEINFVKWTPVRADTGNVTPVLLENWSFTAMGNDAMEDFDETSFSQASVTKGDIIYTQIKTSGSGVTVYFNATMEIEI